MNGSYLPLSWVCAGAHALANIPPQIRDRAVGSGVSGILMTFGEALSGDSVEYLIVDSAIADPPARRPNGSSPGLQRIGAPVVRSVSGGAPAAR